VPAHEEGHAQVQVGNLQEQSKPERARTGIPGEKDKEEGLSQQR